MRQESSSYRNDVQGHRQAPRHHRAQGV